MANDLIEELFEGGSNGANITTANTSADHVTGPPTFTTTAHEGSLAANFNTSSSTSQIRFDHSTTDGWYVFRIRLAALPAGAYYIASWYDAAGTGKIGDMRVNTSGTLTVRNVNTAAVSTTVGLSTTTWHRVAVHIQTNTVNGIRIKTYTDSNVDGDTADEDVTMSSGATTANLTIGQHFIGIGTTSTWNIQIDQIEASSTAEPMPAAPSDTIDPVAVVEHTSTVATFDSAGDLTAVEYNVTAENSTDNTAVTGYSWADGGAGGTWSSSTAEAPTWTPPDLVSGPWTLTCTVSDAAANTNADSVVVNADFGSASTVYIGPKVRVAGEYV